MQALLSQQLYLVTQPHYLRRTTMSEYQTIVTMVIMSATLIILAMVSKWDYNPIKYAEPVEQYYYNTDNYMVEPKTDNIDYIDIDDLEFDEAFNLMRRWKGAKSDFFWHGKRYNTNHREEGVIPSN